MKARNIDLFTVSLFVLVCFASASFADVSVCSWIAPNDAYPTCGEGEYGATFDNSSGDDIDIIVYLEIWTCMDNLLCTLSGSPAYYNCMTATIPANTDCNDPYTVIFNEVEANDRCICPGPYSDGIFFLREYVWLECDIGLGGDCADIPGNCGSGNPIYWGGQPDCCGDAFDSTCIVIDTRDLVNPPPDQHRCCE